MIILRQHWLSLGIPVLLHLHILPEGLSKLDRYDNEVDFEPVRPSRNLGDFIIIGFDNRIIHT
jgi:hypothetical protein